MVQNCIKKKKKFNRFFIFGRRDLEFFSIIKVNRRSKLVKFMVSLVFCLFKNRINTEHSTFYD